MRSNMGTIDKGVRIILAMLIAGAYYNKEISGLTAIVLLIIAALFIVTSAISFCPLYSIFKISTHKRMDG
jgi:uncharacterized membrane protein YcaP (DUF421 family)